MTRWGQTVVPMNEKDREDATRRIPIVQKRLRESASGYVLVKRFSLQDRAALRLLIEQDAVEIWEAPLGRAYRLKG